MSRLFALAVMVLASIGGQTCKAAIEFTGGEADVTFFYESAANRWDVVFRQKGNTVATGLTSPYTGFNGIVGLDTDFNFNPTLTTTFTTNQFVTVGATTYAITSAEGSSLNETGNTPDLGIRARLRENQVALGTGANVAFNQFDSLNLTLDLANSTFNGISLANAGSPAVSLLSWSGNDAAPMIDSASGLLTGNFANYAHVHRNWGFTQSGTYDLAFGIAGVGGAYGATAGTGSFRMGFNVSVVPEPSALSLIVVGFGLAALRRRRA